MLLATDYPFLDIFWTMVVFFFWVIWIWMVISVLSDVISRQDLSGWGKAARILFVIVLPFVGVLAYLVANGTKMGDRKAQQSPRAPATSNGAAGEIEKAKQLLDSGAITQTEFGALKAKALA